METRVQHEIDVESVQVFRGQITPEMVRRADGAVEVQLDCESELKQTFECSCGQKFRKQSTAEEHIRDVRES